MMRFDQFTENCLFAKLIWVECRMFCPSKIYNIGYALLKQTPRHTERREPFLSKKKVSRSSINRIDITSAF